MCVACEWVGLDPCLDPDIYLLNFRKYKLHVKQILKQLRKAGLQIDIKKLKFSVINTKYLKFIVFIKNVTINLQKIEIIKN